MRDGGKLFDLKKLEGSADFGFFDSKLNPINKFPFGYIFVKNNTKGNRTVEATINFESEGVLILSDRCNE